MDDNIRFDKINVKLTAVTVRTVYAELLLEALCDQLAAVDVVHESIIRAARNQAAQKANQMASDPDLDPEMQKLIKKVELKLLDTQ